MICPEAVIYLNIRKYFIGLLPLLLIAVGGTGCSHHKTDTGVPPVRHALALGLENQVIRPLGAQDSSPVMEMPGELAYQIHQKRYTKAMTEDGKEKEDKASREFE